MQDHTQRHGVERAHVPTGLALIVSGVIVGLVRIVVHPDGSTVDGFAVLSVILAITGLALLSDHVHGTATDGGPTMSVVRTLTRAQESDKIGAGAAHPAVGSSVSLWRIAGTWHVWSPGPKRGTWWLTAADGVADDVLATMRNGESAAPVVFDEYRTPRTHAIAVAATDIRAGIRPEEKEA